MELRKEPFRENPRVKKGIKRALLLIFIGYMMRYPTPYIIVFPHVQPEQWKTFWAVDVLQLIGFGLLLIMLIMYLSEKLKINDYIIFVLFTLSNIYLYTIFRTIRWTDYIHPFFAGYFYSGNGSYFPFFPWLSYFRKLPC